MKQWLTVLDDATDARPFVGMRCCADRAGRDKDSQLTIDSAPGAAYPHAASSSDLPPFDRASKRLMTSWLYSMSPRAPWNPVSLRELPRRVRRRPPSTLSKRALVTIAATLVAFAAIGLKANAASAATLAIDANVSTHQSSASTTISSPVFSTTQANELVVAFISSDGPDSSGGQSFSSVSGGGLTWALRERSNSQAGDAEIWQAVAPSVLSKVVVTATRAKGSYQGAIDVVSFTGANTATNGAVASASAASEAPSVSLTTTHNNSSVWATGNDWDTSSARTVGGGQTLDDQYLDTNTGDTFWTQYETAVTPLAGTKVTINDTSPTSDRWNYVAIEVLPAGSAVAPSAPTNLTAAALSATQATLTWTASGGADAAVGYNIYRSTTFDFTPSAVNLIGSVGSTTAYTDTTAPGTYYYVVLAVDAAGDLSPPSNQATVTLVDTTPPTTPGNLTATAISSSQINLSWSASTDNVGVTGYDLYRGSVLAATLGNVTTYSDTGLAPSTTYSYYITAFDAAGNVSSDSQTATATTQGAATPANTALPVISGTALVGQTLTATNGLWSGSPTAYAYQWQDCNGSGAACSDIAGATHQTYSLMASDAGDTARVVVTASNLTGSGSATSAATATVVAAGSPISIWSASSTPTDADVNDGNAVELGVRFSSSEAGFISAIRFYKGADNAGTHIGHLWTASGTDLATVTFTDETASGWQQANFSSPVSIMANTTYVASYYAPMGRYAGDDDYFATSGVTSGPLSAPESTSTAANGLYTYGNDSFPRSSYEATNYWVDVVFSAAASGASPAAPTGLSATALDATRASLTWTPSSGADAPAGYDVYRSTFGGFTPGPATLIGTTTASSYVDTTNPGTYYYIVEAYDSAGNLSAASNQATVTLVDTTPPTAPSNLTATAISATDVVLSWTASSDNVGVTAYQIYRKGSEIGTSTTVNYTDVGLSPSTSYTYYVTASDAAGNVSPASATADVTTPSSNVIFSDDFAGDALSSAWTIISRHGEYGQNETECNIPQEVGVATNILTITTVAQPTSCGDFYVGGAVMDPPTVWPYATGDVQWTSFNFTYGTVTYRAKFPPQDTSTWPAIWLLGSNCQNTNPYTAATDYDTCPSTASTAYAEIDMTECYSSKWCQLALSQQSSFPACGYPVDDNWHTFTLVWTATSITESVDGQPTGCSFTAANGYKIPSTPMFLIIQTQTGGVGGIPANLPTTLQVSNVTVTQP